MPIQGQRYRFFGWYKVTKLFINQEQERLNIQFKFPSLNEQIEITFEPGYPGYLE